MILASLYTCTKATSCPFHVAPESTFKQTPVLHVCNAACLSFATRRVTAQIVASTLKTRNLENILALWPHLHATAICDKVNELQSATGVYQSQEPASTARGLQNFNLLFVAVAQGS